MNLLVLLGMIGPWQIVIIVVVLLLLFGGRKIPELMRGLGQGMKEFKKATKDVVGSDDTEDGSKKKNETKEETKEEVNKEIQKT
jgi:sec-independent protein translocase protein TatA